MYLYYRNHYSDLHNTQHTNQILWSQGNLGQRASQSGWIRIFGNTLSLEGIASINITNDDHKQQADSKTALEAALRRMDFSAASVIAGKLGEFQKRDRSTSTTTLLRLVSDETSIILRSNTTGV